MKHITEALDKIAGQLEERKDEGLTKLASRLDVVSNTLESTAAEKACDKK